MDIDELLREVHSAVRPMIGTGSVADYIPALSTVEPERFGMAVAMNDGAVHGVGDFEEPFSIQSISKVFALVLALRRDDVGVWQRVGREPSGSAFDSLAQLEYERGKPRNPFINSGALVVTDHLLSVTGGEPDELLEFLNAELPGDRVGYDAAVAASEFEHGERNAAIAYLLSSYGNLHNDVRAVLRRYYEHCAIGLDCRQLAIAASFLSRGGLRRDDSRLLTASQTKRVNSVMLTSGTYDAAGEFAYRVGLPAKSGVGGGILAVVPGRCTIAVWGPGLGPSGNSVAGAAALDEFTSRTGWSIF